jgi:hypothetical protein
MVITSDGGISREQNDWFKGIIDEALVSPCVEKVLVVKKNQL